MSGKVIEMPKSNGQLWSDLFNSFLRDIDKVEAELYPGDPGPEPIPEPSCDDGYEDESWWSDSDTAREMWRDKGAGK